MPENAENREKLWTSPPQPIAPFPGLNYYPRVQSFPGFERRHEKLLPFPKFLGRLGRTLLVAVTVVIIALSIGIVGYHTIARLSWIDSLLNASMILTGMGPVDPMKTNAAKIFASGYALMSGVVFLTAAGILFAPIFHRFIHRFHLADDDGKKGGPGKG
jgi:hypothetical protein